MEEYLELLKSSSYFKLLNLTKDGVEFQFSFHAKPGSKQSYFKIKDGVIIISVTEKPIDGEANEAFIDQIAKDFHVIKQDVTIIRGLKGKLKTVQITMSETKSRPWIKRIEDLRGLLCRLGLQ